MIDPIVYHPALSHGGQPVSGLAPDTGGRRATERRIRQTRRACRLLGGFAE